jgi:hypothetical protein
VLDAFEAEVAKSSELDITPTDCDLRVMWDGWRPVLVNSSGTSFHFVRAEGGTWKAQN